jgi:hypothetical protein
MKTTIKNNFGTLNHVTELILNAEIKFGSNYEGKICAFFETELRPASSERKILSIVYSGHLNSNSGISKTFEQPFQMTNKALEVWKIFVKEVEKELLEYIKNN